MTKKKSEEHEDADPSVWVRQQDTGAIRGLSAKQWRAEKDALKKEGYVPCAEDGTPIDA